MSEPPDDAERSAAERIGTAAREVESALSLSGLGLALLPEELRTLKYLTVLDLSDNLLTELPEWIGELTALEQLVLRGNRLTQLPPSLARLGRLTQLDATDNRLLQVAPELAALPRLATIELRGNPHLLVPPPEVVAHGGRAALEYLRGLGPGLGYGGTIEQAGEPTLLSAPLPPPEPAPGSRERRNHRKVLLIGVPLLAVIAAIAVTAAMSGGGSPGQTSATALPAAQAGTSIGAVTLPPERTATKSATPSHAPTSHSPIPVTERASTHPAAPPSSAASTPPAATTAASPSTTYPTAAPNVDLALSSPATGSSTMQNYVATNAVDGNPNTYWESLDGAAFPQSLTVDLGKVTTVGRFEFALPQVPDWNERTETFTILGSTNGTDFFTIEPSGTYTFNADSASDNSASLTVDPVHARYIELYFTATDGWPAAQLGELDVYS